MLGPEHHVGRERRPTGSSSAEERGVRTDPDNGVASDVAVEDDNLGVVPGGGGDEVVEVRDRGRRPTNAAGGATTLTV